ncbi:hypothetical protein KT99_19699 [Shewanella benthica KT99]|uniref:Uncharacterized protein n=1 Tax=Shewanella benthica KT99 TaxID=314608 RepID=A9D026_9GAMM|nr:hypothetical protein KT99_19699 [Shewanella benthica KT99]
MAEEDLKAEPGHANEFGITHGSGHYPDANAAA